MIKVIVLTLLVLSALCSSHQSSSNSNLMGGTGGMQGQKYPNGNGNPYEMET